jgi:hypothetical protein
MNVTADPMHRCKRGAAALDVATAKAALEAGLHGA